MVAAQPNADGRRDLLERLRWLYGTDEGFDRYRDQLSGNDPDVAAWRRVSTFAEMAADV